MITPRRSKGVATNASVDGEMQLGQCEHPGGFNSELCDPQLGSSDDHMEEDESSSESGSDGHTLSEREQTFLSEREQTSTAASRWHDDEDDGIPDPDDDEGTSVRTFVYCFEIRNESLYRNQTKVCTETIQVLGAHVCACMRTCVGVTRQMEAYFF